MGQQLNTYAQNLDDTRAELEEVATLLSITGKGLTELKKGIMIC
jgi:hypothetical protein